MGGKSLQVFIAACIVLALSAVAVPVFAAGITVGDGIVSSNQLIENPDKYDEKQVVYEGEAVGDILQRGEFAWVTVNDDHYSQMPRRKYEELKGGNSGIGVYGPMSDMEDIDFLGSYDTLGDRVEIRGTFYKASADHGGDTCIVADEIRVIERGCHVSISRLRSVSILAGILLAICVVLVVILILKRGKRFGQ